MSTITFLKHVLGEEGYYCLFAVGEDGKPSQKFFDSVEAMDEFAVALDEENYDVYFALATFESKGSRKASNVLQMRSFFLDLDCGVDKPFKTQQAALHDLRQFCHSHQLPRPTMVNSGRGVHAYWSLEAPIPVGEWLPLASRFKAMCLSHPLAIDASVPADSARVLRYPGSRNHKDEPPKAVSIMASIADPIALDEMVAVLDHYAPEGEEEAKRPSGMHRDPLMNALLGNQTSRFKTILERCQKGRGCNQLCHIAKEQAGIEEPLWRAGLSIAVNCVDGDKAIHIISKKHPAYDPAETEEKANLTAGPYHCSTFAELNPEGCKECPHQGKITSPIQLGREIIRAEAEDNLVYDKPENMDGVALQPYTIPDYPWPYFRGKNGGVYVETEDRDGDRVEQFVYENDFYVVRRVVDPEDGDAMVARVHMPMDGIREFTVPLVAATSRDELRKHLSRSGIAVSNVEMLMQYSLKWVQKLAQEQSADVSRRQFGWIDEDYTGFALGRMMVFKDRIEINSPSSRTASLFPMFEPRGSLEKWKNTINFFNRPGFESYQYVVGTAFGSVLTKMTAINGSMFHFYSKDSGYGKTTAMYAAASVWANPMKYVKYERDTMNDKMLYAETLKDLPLYLDELTNMSPKDASDTIYQIPSGMQRGRMATGANNSRWRGDPWRLISVSTGNASLISKVASYKDAPKAEMQRVIECSPERMSFNSKAETDQFALDVNMNYGHAGVIFLQFVLNNTDKVKDTLAKVQKSLDERIGLTAQNRFWSAQAACVITGLMIAKKLGLVDYNVKKLTEWTVNYLSDYRVDDFKLFKLDPQQIISEYFYDNVNNFLLIKSTDRNVSTGLDHLVVPDATPKVTLRGRLETDTNVLYLLPNPFKAWCADKQIDYSWVFRELKKEPCEAKSVSKRLGKGTKMNLPPVNVIQINGVSWLQEDGEEESDTETTTEEA